MPCLKDWNAHFFRPKVVCGTLAKCSTATAPRKPPSCFTPTALRGFNVKFMVAAIDVAAGADSTCCTSSAAEWGVIGSEWRRTSGRTSACDDDPPGAKLGLEVEEGVELGFSFCLRAIAACFECWLKNAPSVAANLPAKKLILSKFLKHSLRNSTKTRANASHKIDRYKRRLRMEHA